MSVNLVSPSSIAIDSSSRTLFVGASCFMKVGFLNASTYTFVGGTTLLNTSGCYGASIGLVDDPEAHAVLAANGLNNLSVIDSSSLSVVRHIPTGAFSFPGLMLYLPSVHEIYVLLGGPNTDVLVLNASTLTTVTTIMGVSSNGDGIIYDSANGLVYVSGGNYGLLQGIDPRTNAAVGGITLSSTGGALGYDPIDHEIYVATGAGISVVNTSSSSVVTTLSVPSPTSFTWDPTNGVFFLTEPSNILLVLNGSTNARGPSIPVGAGPTDSVLDPFTGDLLTTNSGSNNLSEIDPVLYTPVGSVSLGYIPGPVAYDSRLGMAFVACRSGPPGSASPNAVAEVGGSPPSILGDILPGVAVTAMTYAPDVDQLVVLTGSPSASVLFVDPGTGITVTNVPLPTPSPTALVWDGVHHRILVWGSNGFSAIDDTTGTIVANPHVVQSVGGLALDTRTGNLVVTNASTSNMGSSVASASILTLNGSTYTVQHQFSVLLGAWSQTGISLGEVAVNPDQDTAYVAVDRTAQRVVEVDLSNGSTGALFPLGSEPQDLAYSNLSGDVFFTSYNATIQRMNELFLDPVLGSITANLTLDPMQTSLVGAPALGGLVASEGEAGTLSFIGWGTSKVHLTLDANHTWETPRSRSRSTLGPRAGKGHTAMPGASGTAPRRRAQLRTTLT